ncbi:unnamed protein product [[Actinomadura] parvosata subsp. kistnae]|uniref:Uncharacterized protein n=1 Tax=[Actinomadura] parvosata subsp. kistnae TaxID=1909395 RepID=A0A1V0A2T2_9ACTN|nr:hypothetical protein [Nonomuraea sp. ATCC 55076]AQZ64526.1 hypothetical protein BKM31_26445 [Nonomuraea sp. ATCC 55076]SPL89349.1 unnamed protein product [Actinomadura parvosata subsp. kistnae]
MVDDERTPSPEEMLRVIEEQSVATTRWLRGDPLFLYAPWGVAWMLGFTALFLHYGLDGRSYAPISQMQAVGVLMAGQLVAGAFVAYGIVRMNKTTRGDSNARGAMFGYAWFAGFALMVVICSRMSPLLPPQESGLLWAGSSLMLVATLYMAGGALFHNWTFFFFGVWVAAVNTLGVLLGAGWHALLTAVLLGGGYIVAGVLVRRRS